MLPVSTAVAALSPQFCYDMCMTDSTNDTFQQRRALDLAFDALGKTENEAEVVQGAYAIADAFPAGLVTAALLKRLDTPNSQLRGGLARLASFLPEAEITAALQEYAGKQSNPPQGRVTAAMILERFLARQLRPGTLADLQGNEDAAVQSLHDAVYEGEEDVRVLVDYVTQMQAYPGTIAHQVMQHLDNMEPGLRVNLLMLIATDPRPQVARFALQRLEDLADRPDLTWPQNAPENAQRRAQRALHVLVPNLAKGDGAAAERVLRKAHFRGAGYQPPAEALRCFMGMPHYSTAYTLEFWRPKTNHAQPAQRLAVLLQSDAGFVAGDFGEEVIPGEYLRAGTGAIQRTGADGRNTWHVEIPARAGRWLLTRELQGIVDEETGSGSDNGGPEGLPGFYRGALAWLWDAPRATPDAAWVALVEGERSKLDLPAARKIALTLLDQPALAHWDLIDAVLSGPQRNMYRGKLREEVAPVFFAQVAAPEVQAVLIGRMQAALRLVALWLHFAGQDALANDTADLAYNMGAWTPQENPLLRRMLGIA